MMKKETGVSSLNQLNEIAEKIAAGITVFRLCCTKNPSSAFLMKEEIDNEYH